MSGQTDKEHERMLDLLLNGVPKKSPDPQKNSLTEEFKSVSEVMVWLRQNAQASHQPPKEATHERDNEPA